MVLLLCNYRRQRHDPNRIVDKTQFLCPRLRFGKQTTLPLLVIAITWIFLVARPAQAQVSMTVTPGNTHQTWRFYGGNVPTTHFDDTGCSVVSSTLFNQAVAYLNDAGVNQGRIEINPTMNIESSDN